MSPLIPIFQEFFWRSLRACFCNSRNFRWLKYFQFFPQFCMFGNVHANSQRIDNISWRISVLIIRKYITSGVLLFSG